MTSSIGTMTSPTEWKNNSHIPNHQADSIHTWRRSSNKHTWKGPFFTNREECQEFWAILSNSWGSQMFHASLQCFPKLTLGQRGRSIKCLFILYLDSRDPIKLIHPIPFWQDSKECVGVCWYVHSLTCLLALKWSHSQNGSPWDQDEAIDGSLLRIHSEMELKNTS